MAYHPAVELIGRSRRRLLFSRGTVMMTGQNGKRWHVNTALAARARLA